MNQQENQHFIDFCQFKNNEKSVDCTSLNFHYEEQKILKVKCGEIFTLGSYDKLIFTCIFCYTSFQNSSNFVKHIKCHKYENNVVNEDNDDPLKDILHDGKSHEIACEIISSNKNQLNDDYIKKEINIEYSEKSISLNLNVEDEEDKNLITRLNHDYQEKNLKNKSTGRKQKIDKIYSETQLEKSSHSNKVGKTIDKNDNNKLHNDDEESMNSVEKGPERTSSSIFTESVRIDPLLCNYCPRRLECVRRRIEHESIHTGEKPFECEICKKRYSSKSRHTFHMKMHKGITPKKSHKCKFCGKAYVRKSEKNQHENIHTGEKPYQCTQCGKCYRLETKLRLHIKKHLGIRSYKCDKCDKSFYTKQDLTEHAVMHTNDRPFVCEICKATFPRKKALRSHEKIHSDIAQYVCKICGKEFKQGPGLYCHMKVHGEKINK